MFCFPQLQFLLTHFLSCMHPHAQIERFLVPFHDKIVRQDVVQYKSCARRSIIVAQFS